LCGLIREVPVIVAGRAVDELADDVGMACVPSDFCRDVHHDLVEGDLLPIRGPPWNSAWGVERAGLNSCVCVDCCLLIQGDDVFSRLLSRGPHVGVDFSAFVKPGQLQTCRPIEHLPEVIQFDAGHMLHKPKQICAGLGHRPSHITLADTVQLCEQRPALFVQITVNNLLRVHRANLVGLLG
jgi:hypothetical protein